MRVTHVITRLIVGGAQENTVASVLGLQKKTGLEVELISGPTQGLEGSLESEFAVAPDGLTIVPSLIRSIRPWADVSAYFQLVAAFRQRSPTIVHTHSGKAGFLGRLAARRARIPLIIHTIHGPSFGPFQGWAANAVLTQAEQIAGRVTDHFVVVADAMTRQYLAAGIGQPADYTRIFSGFDLAPFLQATRDARLAAELGLRDDEFVVGKIARLWETKGHDDLVAITPALVKQIPNLRILLLGDGPWRARLEQQMVQAGVRAHFIFAGLVPPSEVPRYLGLMDVVVHLSRREGLARALPQALAAGKPILAYDCDGANEVCLDEQTGFLLPVGAAERLVQLLPRLQQDTALRQRLGATGRAFVRGRFSVERMVDDLYELYLRLARARGLIPPCSA